MSDHAGFFLFWGAAIAVTVGASLIIGPVPAVLICGGLLVFAILHSCSKA